MQGARVAVAVSVMMLAGGIARGDRTRERVVVWPQAPEDNVAAATAVVRDAGHDVVPFAPIGDRLRARGEDAARAEKEVLSAVEAGLAGARGAYLKQDFAGMARGLAAIEAVALPVVARPSHTAVLWELEFQRGLAELARRDAATARKHFTLALELDEQRTPRRDLYGPDVVRAFAEAADARGAVPPRPAAVRATPPDARVVIDGVPVIDNRAPRNVRPGLHVVAAAAPG